MTNVIKRDGKKQAFSPAKLRNSVLAAARDAKVPSAKAKKLVAEVADPVIALAKKKRVIKVIALRKSILGRLETRLKSVANAWRRYEKKKCKCCK